MDNFLDFKKLKVKITFKKLRFFQDLYTFFQIVFKKSLKCHCGDEKTKDF